VPDTPLHEPLKLGLISEGTNTWPLYVAQALGMFQRYGLTVNVSVVGSSVKQQEELIRGGYDVGFQQPDHVVRAVEQGADLFIFAAHGHAPDLTLVAQPGITGIEALRGQAIAVDGARSGYALLLARLLQHKAFAESEVVFKEIGGSKERFDAMKDGSAAASMLNPPFDATLIASGYVSLARIAEEFPTYPGSVMAARRGWAKTHGRELKAFVRGLEDANAWLRDPDNALRAFQMLPQRLAIAPEAAGAALDKFARRAPPRLTAEGMQQVIDIVWASEGYTQAKGEPAKYMDLSYMNNAE
jgi:ABC-type nitrate/sulfonate/bicarbonate transport system substrate-binding protein